MDAIPRAVEVSVRARANGVSSGASRTKMADITLRWSQGGRLWRCCWSLADYWVGGHYGLLAGRVQAGKRAAAGSARRAQQSYAACRRHVEWAMAMVRRLRLYSQKVAT